MESQEITAGLDSGHGDNSRHDDNGGTAAECRHQLRAVEPVPARSRQPVPDRLLTLLGGELLPTLFLLKSQNKTLGGGFFKNGLLCNDSRRSCARLFSHVQHSMSMIFMVIN